MKMSLVILTLVIMYFCVRFSRIAINKYGQGKGVSPYRIKYISKTITFAILAFFLILMANISGVEYSQISIFLSSVFAVIGVALFAQWSILSNITASLIIFFGFPYRVGDKIKVLDKDDDISGVIEEITLFHVLIKRGEEVITYPNILILQKGVIKNPTKKLD
ncbi:mechanosensitive ion channel family protein [Paraferrimonas sp. SM1919]|uniref:mechanosensitive ion channel family protein n=1 Tax=Paraferrimonas sp. SM1919 TaxID=2662263 RepID=UPI0013D7AB6D|nr:mechanosensitive ion channel family protein [Paraferrimonas sp. SM1919]